jgi:hypothetical protein
MGQKNKEEGTAPLIHGFTLPDEAVLDSADTHSEPSSLVEFPFPARF